MAQPVKREGTRRAVGGVVMMTARDRRRAEGEGEKKEDFAMIFVGKMKVWRRYLQLQTDSWWKT
jgi:hypothetical protein